MIGIIRRNEDGHIVAKEVFNILPENIQLGDDDEQFDLEDGTELQEFNDAQPTNQYTHERAQRYASVGDQLDLLIKSLKHMKAEGVDIGDDGDELIAMSDEVKTQYPKP